MPPKFSLQSILDFQHRQVEILEVEMSQLLRLRLEAQDLMNRLLGEQKTLYWELSDLQTGDMDLVAISQVRSAVKRLNEQIVNQQIELERLDRLIEDKRVHIVQTKQDESVLEKLREKEWSRFEEKVIRQE